MSEQPDVLSLAKEVMGMAREQLLVNMRFLDMAINALRPVPLEDEDWPEGPDGATIAPENWVMDTDGRRLLYNPQRLLKAYRQDANAVMRKHMHTLLHCLYRHMFNNILDDFLWELACDMAVHVQISETRLPILSSPLDSQRGKAINRLTNAGLKGFTAEVIYRFLCEHPQDGEILQIWSMLFHEDEHLAWYQPPSPTAGSGEDDGDGSGDGSSDSDSLRGQAEALWRDVTERMELREDGFGPLMGNMPGSMRQSIRHLNRERYDYGDFLRRFSAPCEVMKLSEDEFDYIYYSYGLQQYGSIPLVEPLEYREDKRIHDFVIAIDTSGSTFTHLVRRFLQKTYNIIKQQQYFQHRFNLHIIQCDAAVQEDAVITCDQELEAYISNLQVHGGGGTDFRPVFSHVEKLRREGRFRDLRGLIYFTDGMGTYPATRTPYQTAFVFLESDTYDDRNVPPWASKIILSDDQLD